MMIVPAAALLIALLSFAGTHTARADGDPASDVLAAQPLFLPADADVPASEQARLRALLAAAIEDGMPTGVAIIASPSDLGAVTELWDKPRSYARFLGLELSLVDRARLLVVMPDGLGFYWSRHSPASSYRAIARIEIARGGAGLARAASMAVASLAAAAQVRLTPGGQRPGDSAARRAGKRARRAVWPGAGTDRTFGLVTLAAFAAALVALQILLNRRRRVAAGARHPRAMHD
jgi:hypothetical protein